MALLLFAIVFTLYVAALTFYVLNFITDFVVRQQHASDRFLKDIVQRLHDTQTTTITQVAKSIGAAVARGQVPPTGGLSKDQLREAVSESMDRSNWEGYSPPDLSDPTDGVEWLNPQRETVVMGDDNDPEPFGVPGLRPLHEMYDQQEEGEVTDGQPNETQ